MTKIICFNNLKGGVGKTNLCFQIAGCLAKENKKILCLDFDPQANLSQQFGYYYNTDYSAKDIFNEIQPAKLIKKTKIPEIQIIPSTIYLSSKKIENVFATRKDGDLILAKYLNQFQSFFENYDYILVDTAPSMSSLNRNAVLCSHSVIVPTDVSKFSYYATGLLYILWNDLAKEHNLQENPVKAIITTMTDPYSITKQFKNDIKKHEFKELFLKSSISRRTYYRKSEYSGIPLAFNKKKGLDAEVQAVINELKEKGII